MGVRTISKTIDLSQLPKESKYITEINDTGITIHPKVYNGSSSIERSSYIQLDGSGMELFNSSGISIAKYGEDIRLGNVNEGKLLITAGGQGHTYEQAGTYIIDENDNILAQFLEDGIVLGQIGTAHIEISDKAQKIFSYNGTNTISEIGAVKTFIGTQTCFTLGVRAKATNNYDASLTYNVGDMVLWNGYDYVCKEKITTPEPWTSSHWAVYVGEYSVSEGDNNIASGRCAHAEGYVSRAIGNYSHAESGSRAFGNESHAEGNSQAYGNYSHAQNQSNANGLYSHSEGYLSSAYGDYSHAQNLNTTAWRQAQTAIGSYNETDTGAGTTHPSGTAAYGQYAVIVGNGTSSSSRSNALTVDWDGNVWCAGGITATPTEITLTYSQCTTGSYTRCYRIGNIVFLSFNINVTTATASYDYITGLPPALGGGWATSSGFGSGAMTRWWVTTSGTLRADGTPTAGWHNGNIVYICQ